MLDSILPTAEHRELIEKTLIVTLTVLLVIAVINIAIALLVFAAGSLGIALASDAFGDSKSTGSKTAKLITKKSSLFA